MLLFALETSSSKILPGVYINGLYVGGMTKDEATDVITNELSQFLLDNNTKIVNGDTELVIHASNIANIDIDELVESAYDANRENLPISYVDFIMMKFTPINIKTTAILDWQSIYNVIELNQHLFYTPAVDSKLMDYNFVDGQLKLVISPSQTGYQLDIRETTTIVQQALAQKTMQIYAIMETIEPTISTESLMQMANNPSKYSQHFPVVYGEKYYKVPEDLQTIDNLTEPMLIMPGQSISVKDFMMYDAYNPIVESIKSIHIPSIIYGCATQLGLTVGEHHVPYYITDDMLFYPLGQEAVLADNRDLVLTNNFSYPVIMLLTYDNINFSHRLTCKIYYVESLEYTYIKSVIEEHDAMYYVKVYRVYANDTGGVLSRTLLEEHEYPVPPKANDYEEEIIEQMS